MRQLRLDRSEQHKLDHNRILDTETLLHSKKADAQSEEITAEGKTF